MKTAVVKRHVAMVPSQPLTLAFRCKWFPDPRASSHLMTPTKTKWRQCNYNNKNMHNYYTMKIIIQGRGKGNRKAQLLYKQNLKHKTITK